MKSYKEGDIVRRKDEKSSMGRLTGTVAKNSDAMTTELSIIIIDHEHPSAFTFLGTSAIYKGSVVGLMKETMELTKRKYNTRY